MKKILSFIFVILIIFAIPVQAKTKNIKNELSSIIKKSALDQNAISISVKNLDNGKVVYSLNDKILRNPASVQKILTTPVSYEVLGKDYNFKTALYKRGENSFVIKLGADPYFTSKNLKSLVSLMPRETKRVCIDDSLLDDKTWGEGWQWDDDMNILMPRFGSYNLDGNLIKLTVVPSENGQPPLIINSSKYPLVFFNNVVNSNITDISVKRDSSISLNSIVINGKVSKPTSVYIPSNNIKQYFLVQLTKILESKKIYLKESYKNSKLLSSDVLVDSVTHSIDPAIDDILKQSNNLISEVLFKLAGAKYCGMETGTDYSGIKMFNDYCQRNNLDNSKIKITDASGVSKNNLVSADFITEFLVKNKNNEVLKHLPSPGEGTMSLRMLPLKDFVNAKTGTLSDVSSIAGYISAKSGKKYSFCIIINDMSLSESGKKVLEDYLIKELYLKF